MTKEIRRIENEKVLLEYLYKRLVLGNTNGIKEEEYLEFLSLLEEKISNNGLGKIEFSKEDFSSIYEKAMAILKRNAASSKLPLIYSDNLGIIPTYDLRKISYNDYRIFDGSRESFIVNEVIKEITPSIVLSDYDWIKFDSIEAAQKIASFYIDELAKRYMKEMIILGYLQVENIDIDKYIFEQDLGKFFNLYGTKEAFIKAYLHSTRIISEVLDKRVSGEEVRFSNNPMKTLAYANYLKMILPEELKFLMRYSHRTYALNDPEINIASRNGNASYERVTCVSFDETGEWSDAYEREYGNVLEDSVKIMKKRLGNRNPY